MRHVGHFASHGLDSPSSLVRWLITRFPQNGGTKLGVRLDLRSMREGWPCRAAGARGCSLPYTAYRQRVHEPGRVRDYVMIASVLLPCRSPRTPTTRSSVRPGFTTWATPRLRRTGASPLSTGPDDDNQRSNLGHSMCAITTSYKSGSSQLRV